MSLSYDSQKFLWGLEFAAVWALEEVIHALSHSLEVFWPRSADVRKNTYSTTRSLWRIGQPLRPRKCNWAGRGRWSADGRRGDQLLNLFTEYMQACQRYASLNAQLFLAGFSTTDQFQWEWMKMAEKWFFILCGSASTRPRFISRHWPEMFVRAFSLPHLTILYWNMISE